MDSTDTQLNIHHQWQEKAKDWRNSSVKKMQVIAIIALCRKVRRNWQFKSQTSGRVTPQKLPTDWQAKCSRQNSTILRRSDSNINHWIVDSKYFIKHSYIKSCVGFTLTTIKVFQIRKDQGTVNIELRIQKNLHRMLKTIVITYTSGVEWKSLLKIKGSYLNG